MKRVFQAATFLVMVFVTTAAFAATAMVTTTLHLRSGPGSRYRIVTSMPDGAVVDIPGCARGYNWCRVNWNGYRGWASASYLAFRRGRYRHRAFSHYGAEIGIPLIAGAVIGNVIGGHEHHRHRRYHGHYRHDGHHGHYGHGGHRRHARHERRRIRHLRHQKRRLHRKLRRARHHHDHNS